MKKKINVILIVVVALLWSTLIYKTLGRFFSTGAMPETSSSAYTATKFVTKRDTFAMEPIVRDPFLGKIVTIGFKKKNNSAVVLKKAVVKTPIFIPEPDQWPDIKYYGYIKSDKNEFALIKINNVIFRLHKNEIKQNVRVTFIYKDSIQIAYLKYRKVILRSDTTL